MENTASLGGDGVDDYCDNDYVDDDDDGGDDDDDYDGDDGDDDKDSFVKLMLLVKSEDEIWRNYWQRPAQC